MKDLYLVIREDVDLNNLTEEQEQALMYCLLKAYVMLAEAEKGLEIPLRRKNQGQAGVIPPIAFSRLN